MSSSKLSDELEMFAIASTFDPQVNSEIKASLWKEFKILKKYEEDLNHICNDLEHLACKYDALLRTHTRIKIAGSVAGITGSILGIVAGAASIATAGAAIPFMARGLLVAGTMTGIGGGVTKIGNDRMTRTREAELDKEFERILTAHAESHEVLRSALEAIKRDRCFPDPEKGTAESFWDWKHSELFNSVKRIVSQASFSKEDLLNGAFESIKFVGSKSKPSAHIVPGVASLSDDLLAGSSKAAGKTLANETSKKAAVAVGGAFIVIGVFSLGY
eukprot:TCALIF_13752-PA protein Name:"Protein of unknown function" AED:0.02 eAED:0.02 QI:27/1/0.5/1/1/0.5/2/0/273